MYMLSNKERCKKPNFLIHTERLHTFIYWPIIPCQPLKKAASFIEERNFAIGRDNLEGYKSFHILSYTLSLMVWYVVICLAFRFDVSQGYMNGAEGFGNYKKCLSFFTFLWQITHSARSLFQNWWFSLPSQHI